MPNWSHILTVCWPNKNLDVVLSHKKTTNPSNMGPRRLRGWIKGRMYALKTWYQNLFLIIIGHTGWPWMRGQLGVSSSLPSEIGYKGAWRISFWDGDLIFLWLRDAQLNGILSSRIHHIAVLRDVANVLALSEQCPYPYWLNLIALFHSTIPLKRNVYMNCTDPCSNCNDIPAHMVQEYPGFLK